MIDSVQVPWGKGEIEPRALLLQFFWNVIQVCSNVEWNRSWNFLFTSTWRRNNFVTMVPFAWWVSKFKIKASLSKHIYEGVEKSRTKYSLSFCLKTRKHVIEPWTSWSWVTPQVEDCTRRRSNALGWFVARDERLIKRAYS